jgi:hypothetical protein
MLEGKQLSKPGEQLLSAVGALNEENMRWLYYIPHSWEDPDGNPREKAIWEDVYLMPDNPDCQKSIWLTVDGYQAEDMVLPSGYVYEKTWFGEREFEIFQRQGYLIRNNGCDMIVFTPEFTKKELLDWAKLFLEEGGHVVTKMEEAPFERFAGTNQHACMTAETARMVEELESLDPSEREKRLVPLDSLDLPGDSKKRLQ